MPLLHSEELREQYEGKLSREMSGMFYEVFSRVMRVLVGKKITVPGTFKRWVCIIASLCWCFCPVITYVCVRVVLPLILCMLVVSESHAPTNPILSHWGYTKALIVTHRLSLSLSLSPHPPPPPYTPPHHTAITTSVPSSAPVVLPLATSTLLTRASSLSTSQPSTSSLMPLPLSILLEWPVEPGWASHSILKWS